MNILIHLLLYALYLSIIYRIYRFKYKNGIGRDALWNIDFQKNVFFGNSPLSDKERIMSSIPKGGCTSILFIALSLLLLVITALSVYSKTDLKLWELLITPLLAALPGGIGIASIVSNINNSKY